MINITRMSSFQTSVGYNETATSQLHPGILGDSYYMHLKVTQHAA